MSPTFTPSASGWVSVGVSSVGAPPTVLSGFSAASSVGCGSVAASSTAFSFWKYRQAALCEASHNSAYAKQVIMQSKVSKDRKIDDSQ